MIPLSENGPSPVSCNIVHDWLSCRVVVVFVVVCLVVLTQAYVCFCALPWLDATQPWDTDLQHTSCRQRVQLWSVIVGDLYVGL